MKIKNIVLLACIVSVTGFYSSTPLYAFSFRNCKQGCDTARNHCENTNPEGGCDRNYDVCLQRCVSEGIKHPQYSADELKTYYGAIAYDPKTGSWGYSIDNEAPQDAEKAAKEGCQKAGADCSVIVPLNNQCGAVVSTPEGSYSYSTSGTKKAAEKRALDNCRRNEQEGCEVKVSVCTRR